MSSSFTFYGEGFFVASAQSQAPAVVRVKFSNTPQASDVSHPNDAKNPNNYAFSGPGPATPISVSPVSGDPLSFDVHLTAPLNIGTWTVTVSNVQDVDTSPLVPPTAAVFQVTVLYAITGLSGGAENDDPESIIRKHLSSAMQGPNWDALIAALSTGDNANWANAESAFDQLFLSTASGSWLEKKASDQGILEPTNVGMTDDLFRQYVIKLSTGKVVHESIREILEVFYGQDSSRAFVEANLDEPYDLSSHPDLQWVLDEDTNFTITFQNSWFAVPSKALAVEVAVALTNVIRQSGSDGFAIPIQSVTTGLNRVRIYSGSLGLGSFARVTGGLAQNVFNFPTLHNVYSGTISPITGYNWTYTQPNPNVTQASLSIDTSIAAALIDLSSVSPGDYVVITSNAGIGVTGTFQISNVSITWSGSIVTQSFQIPQISFLGSANQAANNAYSFYSPTKNSILAAGGRTVLVAQTTGSTVNISLPATTQAVTRGPKEAFYGRLNNSMSIRRLWRDSNGTVTFTTTSAMPSSFDVGSQVIIDGIIPDCNFPFAAPQSYTNRFVSVTASSCWANNAFASAPPAVTSGELGRACTLTNGQVLITGGFYLFGVGSFTDSANANRYQIDSTTTLADGTEANGAPLVTYHIVTSTSSMNQARSGHGMTPYGTGALVTGGYTFTPSSTLNSTEIYTLDGSWATSGTLVTARGDHQQIVLSNGSIFVLGGRDSSLNSLTSGETFNGTSWSITGSMNFPRTLFSLVELSDGRLMAIGGALTGTNFTNTVEISSDNGATWTIAGSMTYARERHAAIVLPGNYVLVTGGYGYNPSNQGFGSSTSLNQAEIWDPNTGQWSPAGYAGVPRQDHVVFYNSTKNQVIVTGGNTVVSYVDPATIEIFDVATRTWKQWSEKIVGTHQQAYGSMSNGIAFIFGGHSGSGITYDTNQFADMLIQGSDYVSSGGLNGQFVITNKIDSKNFQFTTTTRNTYKVYTSTTGSPTGGFYLTNQGYYNWYIGSAVRTSNITTLTITLPSGFSSHNVNVGDTIYVNIEENDSDGSHNITFSSGIKTVTAITSTTITYAETASNQSSTALRYSSVSVNRAPNASLVDVAASPQPVNDPGPYVYDPLTGLAITSVSSSTTGFELFANQQYSTIQVSGLGQFPNQTGYIAIGFGTPSQAGSIKYLGSYADSPSTTRLILDYSYEFVSNFPIGTNVTLLSQREAFVPANPQSVGSAYITASVSGRVAAEAAISTALAAGITADITIVYPGDRGLGGEGLPTHGVQKLSDIVEVFASDDITSDVATARSS